MNSSGTKVREAAATTGPALAVVRDLFDRLHDADVGYCHWKSNEHLYAAVVGETDLDVLVDRGALTRLESVLARTGFRRFKTLGPRAYPGIESYLGLDPDTGRMVHLHLHTQLTLGERDLKGHRLPWERLLLETRVFDEVHGVHTAEPHIEAVLLAVRLALKLRLRDRITQLRGRPPVNAGHRRELAWLAERIDPTRLQTLGEELLGPDAAALLPRFFRSEGPAWADLRALRRRSHPPLDDFRTFPPLEARGRRLAREALRYSARLARTRRPKAVPRRRVLPQGGLVVAVIGPDGCGKSTVTTTLANWLSAEIDAFRLYLGNGKGPARTGRRVLETAAGVVRSVKRRLSGGGDRGRGSDSAAGAGTAEGSASKPRERWRGQPSGRVRAVGEALWIMALAHERRGRLRMARRGRNLGMVVVCDRFPQRQYVGLNDGAWVGHWKDHDRWLFRMAARAEEAGLHDPGMPAPDLVLRLNVPLERAVERRPDVAPERLAEKAALCRQLRYPPTTRVVEIDAGQPLEAVLRDVKMAVWESL